MYDDIVILVKRLKYYGCKSNLFLRKDTLFGYESIGKKLMRLKIYDLSNNERVKNKKKLIDRNFYSFCSLPIYAFMILINNQSVGDKEMKTTVK